MTELRRIDAPVSCFEEARETLARWEKCNPDAVRLALILVVPDGFEYDITGETMVSDAAGLFFRCAQLACE